MNVLVPGGCGYLGAMLVPMLLAEGHRVTVYDTQWWGRGYLPEDNAHLTVIKADVRNADLFKAACAGQDAVIYLAGITSNAMCVKYQDLSAAVNVDAFLAVPHAAVAAGVKRFIYASSVAAYGASEADAVEEQGLRPSTPYGVAKLCNEGQTRGHGLTYTIARMASICGYSPHQRLDLTVNMMTHDAVRKGVIRVNGGMQRRSHIHIHDACRAYIRLLDAPRETIEGQVFNFVAENQTVLETAQIVAAETGARIDIGPATDDRSYSVDGSKARRVLNFTPQKTVRHAVIDLKARFDSGMWKDSMTNPYYMNLADGLV